MASSIFAVLLSTTGSVSQPPQPQPQPPVPPGGLNVTIFHINEGSYGAAPINMNTGDALGDLYFDLRSKALAIECSGKSTSSTKRDCKNAEVNPPASDPLVVTKIVLEVTAPFAAYGRCNVCVNGTDNHGNNSCTEGAYWCSCGGYSSKPTQCAAGVGRENLTMHYGGKSCGNGDPDYECWREASAKKLGGTWYSTTSMGYGRTWKVAEVVKRVSKTCADETMNAAVESEAAGRDDCFDEKCGPGSTGANRNTSSTCWISCFEATVLGPDAGLPGGVIAGMSVQDLLKAWNAPFDSTDATKGGCPALPVPPVPPPM